MESCPDAIERKAINVEGRLGSLYDASTDLVVAKSYVKGVENPQFCPTCKCQVISGADWNDVINLLKAMEFDDALLQSMLLGVIKPSGISSLYSYSQPINENTCFLYYSYRHRKEKLHITPGKADEVASLPSDLNIATHMITEIIWGFEILCVIQNPDKQSAKKVKDLLCPISTRLQNYDHPFRLEHDEQCQISELTNIIVTGSETCINNTSTALSTVLTRIRDWQNNTSFHCPLLYTMCPLKWLYQNQQFSELCYLTSEDRTYIAQIEPIIIHLDDCLKVFKQLFSNLPKNYIDYTVDQWLKDIPGQYGILLSRNEAFRTNLRNMLVAVRRGTQPSTEIINIVSDERYISLRKPEIDDFCNQVQQWSKKIKLIKKLKDGHITYINALDILPSDCIALTNQEVDAEVENYFLNDKNSVIIWYSNDRLKREKTDDWEKIYQKLTSGQQPVTQQTSLFYVDFSQCRRKLEDFLCKTLPQQSSSSSSRKDPKEEPLPSPSSSEQPSKQPASTPSPTSHRPSSAMTEINVLLLGETGVGKSTFINAFVNYLLFDTLQQAEQNESVVLIPVSFLVTTGDQFDEFVVKFGDADSNENHEHENQSITQHCKSYVFRLNNTSLLRLIDTPGMGDTRGVAQDEKNINHILTYINNLSHLNAICLLFKPNASRLNIFFRSCVSQLFTYLTPISYENIIFCFTNARSTFFAPGDTGPLLRQMLQQEHHDDIPFENQNTFCFDSESFRYLAAKKQNVKFDSFQTEECIKSWTTSVTESIRLLNFIGTRKPYYLDDWQSPRKAALEISTLARPLMETLRLVLYNWKLSETGLLEKELIIRTNQVTVEICSNCAQRRVVNMGSFYIFEYLSAKNKAAQNCQCPFDERHFLIESIVKYQFGSQPVNCSADELANIFHNFLVTFDRLTHFLRQKGLSNENDPFTIVLERFLEEEQQIGEHGKGNLHIDKRVMEMLHTMQEMRQHNKQRLIESDEKLAVNDVYRIINELKALRTVNQQLECIQKSRQLKMEANEYQVKIPSIKNKRFAELTNSFQ